MLVFFSGIYIPVILMETKEIKKKLDLLKNKLILVKWEDSRLMPVGWKFTDDLEFNQPLMTSVGYLSNKSDKYIAVCPSIDDESEADNLRCCGEILIPISCVVEVHKIGIIK